ncbi:hypothetical protein [Enterovirga rhinocerotis]|uniref:Uncharacterized protein n=1 Tax=Enterovirga rhinocerotis TaxID=1339210 RepID=A0A4R7BXK8_9HYPH|nr:hypothetical protein [Enterovirga rhinocerotis]TDR89962.1 hypothetical protein EV668_2799 [Enterovirga rhinocerotis]
MTDDSDGWRVSGQPARPADTFGTAEEMERSSFGPATSWHPPREPAETLDAPFRPSHPATTADVDAADPAPAPAEPAPRGAAADPERERIVAEMEALATTPRAGAVDAARALRIAFGALGSGGAYPRLKTRVEAALTAVVQADRERARAEIAAQREALHAARQEERQARIEASQARREAAERERERRLADRAAALAERDGNFERHAAAKRRVINLILEASQAPGVSGRVEAIEALHGIWQAIGPAGSATRQLAEDYAAARKVFQAAERAERGLEP